MPSRQVRRATQRRMIKDYRMLQTDIFTAPTPGPLMWLNHDMRRKYRSNRCDKPFRDWVDGVCAKLEAQAA